MIKVQVLDLADRFDTLESTQSNQSVMLNYLVNAVRRMEDINLMQTAQVSQAHFAEMKSSMTTDNEGKKVKKSVAFNVGSSSEKK